MINTIGNIIGLNTILTPNENIYQTAKIRNIVEGNGLLNLDNLDVIDTIYTCKSILCNTISKLPINILKDNKKYKEHKYWNLVHNSPNSYQTTNVFSSTMINHLMGYGNAFAKIIKTNGNVDSLQIKHPSTLTGYNLNRAGVLTFSFTDEDINNEDLIHLKLYSDNGITGVNPISAIKMQLSINGQANTTIDSYYRNGLHTSKVMKSMSNTTNKEYDQAQQNWAKNHTGSLKAGEMFNLPFGSEIQELKLDFADAQLLPTIIQNSKSIASAYGIPLWMLGLEPNSKTIEESILAFQVMTIQPLAKMIKEEFSRKLLTETERYDEVSIELNLNSMLAANSITRATYLKLLKEGAIICANDAAKIEGFDSYEGGQYHYQQSQNQPLELITKDGEFRPITNGTTDTSKKEDKSNDN